MAARSRMSSAISFGVFCRLAPSMSAIIRSRKAPPGLAMTSTTIQSDKTASPVTELRSPPASRITGALSPVMAASCRGDPSTMVPSAGISSRLDEEGVAFAEQRCRDDSSRRRASAGGGAWPRDRAGPSGATPLAPCRDLRQLPRRNWRTAR